MASSYGHKEIVAMILQDNRVKPEDEKNFALRYASSNGHKKL
jgi:hypothetical protein